MVAAGIMNIECARVPLDSSLFAALKAVGGSDSGAAAFAVVDAETGGRFVGSLSCAKLVAELAGAGWHCGNASIVDALDGTAGVGIATLVDREVATVGPEVSLEEVVRLLLGKSSDGKGSDAFVAVVDDTGVLLGTITHADLIASLLEVAEVE
jgi:CBS domain-containing protein